MAMSFAAGDVLEQVDLNNILQAAQGNGVLDGLAVSEDSPAGMDVDVASGNAYISPTKYTESSTVNLAIAAAHATLHRKDLVTYDPTTSNPLITQGTNHAGGDSDPIYPPDIPSGDILLAIVNVDAAATSITNSDIDDKRLIVNPCFMDTILSDILNASDDLADDTTSTTYVKLKELTISQTGLLSADLRIKFDLKTNSVGKTAYGRIRRNGVEVGAEQTETGVAYVTKSQDISGWATDDLIQVYAKNPLGYTTSVDNFRIYSSLIPIIE